MFGLFKQKAITIINKQQLVETMTSIVDILNTNNNKQQADAVNKPLQYLQQDDIEKFLDHIKSVDIWGGAGAAWEVGNFPSKQMEREFESHFIRLSVLLKETGIKVKPANQIARIFKRNLQEG